jgi:hypothetical protein
VQVLLDVWNTSFAETQLPGNSFGLSRDDARDPGVDARIIIMISHGVPFPGQERRVAAGSDPEAAAAPRMSIKSRKAEAPWHRMGDTDDDLRFAAGLLIVSSLDYLFFGLNL